jgi:hypothetical protein
MQRRQKFTEKPVMVQFDSYLEIFGEKFSHDIRCPVRDTNSNSANIIVHTAEIVFQVRLGMLSAVSCG